MNKLFILRNEGNVAALWLFLNLNWKAMADADKPLAVSVSEHKARRSVDQNKRLHAMLAEIADNAWVAGRKYDAEAWKEHFRRQLIGTNEVVLPSGIEISRGISTTTLDVHAFGEFMAKIEAYAVSELGIEFIL